jgi:hypothetical protein
MFKKPSQQHLRGDEQGCDFLRITRHEQSLGLLSF